MLPNTTKIGNEFPDVTLHTRTLEQAARIFVPSPRTQGDRQTVSKFQASIGDILLDTTTRDYVKVTNGIPVKDEQGKETKLVYPTEGIVVRVVFDEGFFWGYISIEGHSLYTTYVTEAEWSALFAKTKGRI